MKKKFLLPFIVIVSFVCAFAVLAAVILSFRDSSNSSQAIDPEKVIASLQSKSEDVTEGENQEALPPGNEQDASKSEDKNAGEAEAVTESSPRPSSLAETESISEETSEAPSRSTSVFDPEEEPPKHKVIFVGDSRTEGMSRAEASLDDDCIYCAKTGEGYDWFIREGIDQLDKAIKNNPEVPVVINLGVNDPTSLSRYLDAYSILIRAYSDTPFYFLSVNPVRDGSGNTTNEEIREFNAHLAERFPEGYIDSYSWMTREGFESADGIHYSDDTYTDLHNYVINAIFG